MSYENHGKKWDEKSVSILLQSIILERTWNEIAEILQRKPGAVKSKYGNLIIDRLDNQALAKSLIESCSSNSYEQADIHNSSKKCDHVVFSDNKNTIYWDKFILLVVYTLMSVSKIY